MLELSFVICIRIYKCYTVLGTYRLNAEIEACIFVMQSNQRGQQQKWQSQSLKMGIKSEEQQSGGLDFARCGVIMVCQFQHWR